MKNRVLILLMICALTNYNSILHAQPLRKLWHALTDKKGGWGINKIPGQNTTAPMVLFNRPTIVEDTAFIKKCIREKAYPIYDIYVDLVTKISGSNSLLPSQGNVESESD
jgi:hypothetical protein